MNPSRPRSRSTGSTSSRVVEYRLGSRFTPGVIAVLVVFAITHVLQYLPDPVRSFWAQHLILTPRLALGREPYQLLTGPLMMISGFSLLFLGILLYSIGSAIEDRLGTRRFLSWLALLSVLSAVAAAAVGRLLPSQGYVPVALDGGAVFMLVLVAFADFYGDLPVRMWGVGQTVSGRGLSFFFLCLGLLAELLRGQWPQLAASVASVAGAFMLCGAGGPTIGRLRRRLTQWMRRRRSGPGNGPSIQVIDGGLSGLGGKKRPPQRYVN